MRVPRSSLMALAALLTGTLASAGALGAETAALAVTPAEAPAAAPAGPQISQPAPQPPSEPAAQNASQPASTDPIATTLPDYKPEAPAAEPAPAAAAAPVVPADPVGAAVLARLGDPAPLLLRLTTKDRDAIRSFYEARAYKPLWVADGAWTEAAKSVSTRLAAAGEDGLDARAYTVPTLAEKPDEKAVADADLRLSAAAVLYARDARGGRVNLASISRLITPKLDLPAGNDVLARLFDTGAKAGDALQSYNPATPGYRALKARLAALRGPAPAAVKPLRLPSGPALRVGMRDSRVPLLRAHFGLDARPAGTLDHGPGEPEAYDDAVAEAVTKFQRGRGLPANGVLNVQTVLALADAGRTGRPSGGEAELIVNMERWRWLPGDLGSDYILVNVPEYRLRAYRGGKLRDEARVIVGKPESRTPLFSGLMEYAVVNPSWYVPPSILKTMAPKLAGYGGKTWGGYEVVRRGGHISLRQPPGERNALGFIKFMFPNQHAVYLHDTPNRSLFSASKRDFSHGCVRVDDPFRLADVVLPDWSEERLKKLIGKGERTIRLPEKLPVHLAYFTAYVDDGGAYRTLPDLYGYDAPMRAALGLPGGGGPAIARLPDEAPRRKAERAPTPAKPRVAQRRAPHSRVADDWAANRYEDVDAPHRTVRRAARADSAPEYGEPGLWTPAPQQPVSRGWW
ncbi:murein L,D-transpeptidase [Methylobacterium sp. A49B]|uniref:L,D-transpeptidase family protein n=1 Tax=Methylobacterium mesophilicum SR1.6/6 TaxID=908290 RepID=A0A6B9FNP6_9HYPH|nr:L,D-transpeptidase family protein [Methylobacterium mesophilicum]QGY02814.1 L,D-transpeptidase family protein [Methylobacterium mesophilicum SR1.6/6]